MMLHTELVTDRGQPLRPHTQISGYVLIRQRGRGGVAEVWEADSPGNYRVALKLVQLSADLRSGELRSLRITRSIRHPSLLEIYGTWQVGNLLVICMELADRSLWERFREVNAQGLRGVPWDELLGYLESVADAIDDLNDHKHSIAGRERVGIQHRDVKPQNILLLGGRAKVGDFGLAQVMEQAVANHTGHCTLPYAAPEYFAGKTSRQSDQYALAVTYCQLRGGAMPFHGSSAQITFGHLYEEPDLSSLPEPERPIVARALAKRPEERWPDCRSFIAALKELGSDSGAPIPDRLFRSRRDAAEESADASHSTGLSVPPADSDFVPIDTGSLASAEFSAESGEVAAFRGDPFESGEWPAGSESEESGFIPIDTASLGSSEFLVLSGEVPVPAGARLATAGVRGGRLGVGRICALAMWMADARPRLAQHAGRAAVRARQLAGSLSRVGLSRAAQLRDGTTRLTAALRSRLAPLNMRIAAGTRSGTDALVRRTRSLARRVRGDATILIADLGPEFGRLARRISGRSRSSLIGLAHSARSLAARPQIRRFPHAAAVWMSERVQRSSHPHRVGAFAVLALAVLLFGMWIVGTRSRPAANALPVASADESARRDVPQQVRPQFQSASVGIPVPALRSKRTDEAASAPTSSKTIAANVQGRIVAKDAELEPPALAGPVSSATPSADRRAPGPVATAAWLRFPWNSRRAPVVASPVREHAGHDASSLPRVSSAAVGDESAQPHADAEASEIAPSVLKVPPTVTVSAGSSAKLPIVADRSDRSTAAHLQFRGLPRGITVKDPTIPAGTAKAEVGLLAAPDAAPGLADVAVVLTSGSERSEAVLQLNVLPDSAALAVERGRTELKRGAYDRAVEGYTEAIRLDPDSFEAHLGRGQAHDGKGRQREALADFTAALRVRPNSAEARLARARLHRELGEYEPAVEDFNEAIRLEPDASVQLARGGVLHELGAYDQALADFDAALRARPEDVVAHYRRGVTRYVKGDNAGAIADFTAVIQHDAQNAEALRYRSAAFARQGEFSRAGADHDAYLRLSQSVGDGGAK